MLDADEALDMGLSVRGVVRSGGSPNAHCLGQPDIERGATRDPLAVDFRGDGFAELPEDAGVVMDEELRLAAVGSGISDLLLYQGQGRVLGDVDVHDLAAAKFHDDEYVEGGEADHARVAEHSGPKKSAERPPITPCSFPLGTSGRPIRAQCYELTEPWGTEKRGG
jgi:hypothetical protein